jgi:hypothetical protein
MEDGMQLPLMAKVRQTFPRPKIDSVPEAVRNELQRIDLGRKVKPGWRVAIAVGSRGIACNPAVVTALCSELKAAGASPFIVAAMGSHGGATAIGQRLVLEDLGITEGVIGAPLEVTVDAVEVGQLEGMPVYLDSNAAKADAIIAVNRIKPHMIAGNRIGSGVMKILAIGLGKRIGCSTIHRHAFGNPDGPYELIERVARLLIQRVPILAGIGIIENAYAQPTRIVAMEAAEIPDTEPKLFQEARQLLASLPVDDLDVLIVDTMGKNISPAGLDPFIIGDRLEGDRDSPPRIKRVVVLDLTEESHGNAVGVGAADLITQRLFDKMDREITYTNCIAGSALENAKIPVIRKTDRDALDVAFATIGPVDPPTARAIRIKSTLEIDTILVSQSLLREIEQKPHVEVVSRPEPLAFDAVGNLLSE